MSNIYRKVQALGTMALASASFGFTYGHLSGMVLALQRHEDGIILGTAQIYVIATAMLFSATFGVVLLAPCGDQLGRRKSLALFSLPLLLSWIFVYFGSDFTCLLISRILAGIAAGGMSTLNMVAAAEFSTPKNRALFQSLISMVAPAVGTGVGHALGIMVNWKVLALAGMAVSVAHMALPFVCVESPQWLASKGRFDECQLAFRQLHGCNATSEEELRLLIKIESNKLKIAQEMKTSNGLQKLLHAMKDKYFWNLILIATFIFIYYSAAGKVIFVNLATVMLEEMTGTSDVLLYTLLIDIFSIIGTCVSIVLIKKMSLRILLFSSGLVAVLVLIVLSACLYFKNDAVYFQWVNVTLLAFYFILVHAGPYPVIEALLGELFPLHIKLFCYVLCAPITAVTVSSSIMLMPILVNLIGYYGMFLLNAFISIVCLGYFWVKLPETKGKTLQQIEVYFRTNNFDVDRVVEDEQIKSFI